MAKFADVYTTAFSQPKEVKRLRAGPLLKLIRDKFNLVNNAYLAFLIKTFNIYGTQGQVIANLLSALNVYNGLAPPTSAVILFELFENNINKNFVKISYFNETSIDGRHTLYLPECYFQEMCPLDLFIEIVDKLIPKDWEKECKIDEIGKISVNPLLPGLPGGLPLIPGLPGFPGSNTTGLPLIPGLPLPFPLPGLPNSPKDDASPNNVNSSTNTGIPNIPGITNASLADIVRLLNNSGQLNISGLPSFPNPSRNNNNNNGSPKLPTPNTGGLPFIPGRGQQTNDNKRIRVISGISKTTKSSKSKKRSKAKFPLSKQTQQNSKSSTSKNAGPKFPYLPSGQSSMLQSPDSKPATPSSAILIIPVLG
ncbi:lysosomal acid phosphatase-like protein, partial [Leptotrombidium deliense]